MTGSYECGVCNRLQRAVHLLYLIEDGIMVLLVTAMILLAVGQIILRDVWDAGVVWGDPLLRISVLWIGMLGAMAATRDNNHITVDIFSRFLSDRLKRIVQIVTGGFAAGICAILAYEGARFVVMDYQAGTTSFSDIPSWCFEIIIPIGFGVMALRFLFVTISPVSQSEPGPI